MQDNKTIEITDATEIAEAPSEISAVLVKEKIDTHSQQSLLAKFNPYHQQINEALATSKTVTSGETLASQKLARTCRLELRRIRCEVENVRKDAKADAVRYGRAVDGLANIMKFICEPEEKRLDDIEKHAERMEAQRIAQLVADRSAALIAVEGNPEAYNLGAMDDATFDATLETARRIRDERIEAERKLEAERVAREKAEAEERERIRQENARLKAEAEEREKAAAKERAEAEAERKRIEQAHAKERAEIEAKNKAERERVEKEHAKRRAEEKAEAEEKERQSAKEREEYTTRIMAEQAAVVKAQREAVEAQRKADEAQRKADEEDRRKEAEAARRHKAEADQKNRKAVMNAAYKDLVATGMQPDKAIAAVEAIAAGKVSHVSINW